MDFISCIIRVSENFRLMKGTMRTVNFRALSSIAHVNAFTVNFRIYHLFFSKVSSVLGNFISFFFASSYSLLVSLMLLRVRQIALFKRLRGHITNAAVLIS